jgi:hypothetical protein
MWPSFWANLSDKERNWLVMDIIMGWFQMNVIIRFYGVFMAKMRKMVCFLLLTKSRILWYQLF